MLSPIPAGHEIHLAAGTSSPALRSGQVVSVRVTRFVGGNTWEVSVSGRAVEVRSNLRLEVGGTFRAVVTTGRAESDRPVITLRIVDEQPASGIARLLTAAGVPDSQAARQLIAAFLNSGVPLLPDKLQTILYSYSKTKKRDPETARLLALASDRNLALTADEVDELLSALPETGGRGDSTDGNGRREDPEDRGGARRGKTEPGAAVPGNSVGTSPRPPVPEGAVPGRSAGEPFDGGGRDLFDGLIEMARFFVERKAEKSDSLLQLFNHLQPGHDRWVVVPFGYEFGSRPIRGTIRLRIAPGTPGAAAGVDRMTLSVEAQGARWVFAIAGGMASAFTNSGYRDRIASSAPYGELRETLSRRGVRLAAAIHPLSDCDGFGEAGNALDFSGVDEER